MLCFLDGNINSCRALFNDLGTFAKFSGLTKLLKPNISKTLSFWAGARGQQHVNQNLNFNFNFKWINKLKVLGIVFSNVEQDSYEDNLEHKLRSIQATMNSWKRRYITMRGKITLIKALLLPKLTNVFVALPKPRPVFMKILYACVIQNRRE